METDHQVDPSEVTGSQKGTPPPPLLISWWRCFDHSLGQGQVCRCSMRVSRVLVKRSQIEQRYTESTRTAVLVGLIMQPCFEEEGESLLPF